MNKPFVLFYFIAASILSISVQAQSPLNQACERFAKLSFELDFNLDSIQHSKNLLLDAIDAVGQKEFNACNCNDSLWILSMRDMRQSGNSLWTHQMKTDPRYLHRIIDTIDLLFLNKEFSFHTLEAPIDTAHYVLDKLRGMAMEPNDKSVRYFNGCIAGERWTLKKHNEELLEDYFLLVKEDTLENYLKDRLLSGLFSTKLDIMDSLLADLITIDSPFFYRICGLLRTNGGEHCTDKIRSMAATGRMDSIQKEFTLTLPITYHRMKLISKKSLRRYGRFIFEYNLYPWCERSGFKHLGEKNERAFKRKYKKYITKV